MVVEWSMSTPPAQWSANAQQLWHAMRTGAALDLAASAPGSTNRASRSSSREIAAETIARLLLQPPSPEPGVVSQLHLIGATITGKLHLPYATVEIPVALVDCRFEAAVELNDASLRAVDLSGSSLPGLNGDRLRIEGDLALVRTVSGAISLFRADVAGDVWLSGAKITGEGADYALRAPQMRIGGGLYAESVHALGGLNLWGSQAFTVEVTNGRLSHATHAALRCDGLHLAQDLRCTGVSVDGGGVSLFGATIGGQCWFNHAEIRNDTGWAIAAPSVRIGGGFYGRSMAVHGGINLFAAAIGESLELSGSTLISHDHPALRASGARVEANLELRSGAVIAGCVSLSRAEIKGTLRLSDSAFTDTSAIDLQGATVGTLDMASLHTLPRSLDLGAASIGRIDDSPGSWPGRIELDRLAYQDLRPVLPADQRLAWLDRSEGYNPQPYERLAAHYRELGHDDDARSVQLARHRKRRGASRPPARVWGFFEDLTVGYGYRPGRALLSLLTLTSLISVIFAAVPPQPASSRGPDFQPTAYALDLILPVLDLGQEKAFIPTGSTSWVAWASAMAGWLLATTVIAGLTRRLSRTGH
ncbi:hypothetical protein [Streptomyces microflavus]|uniref:hypothetical protein n=2 Tax=Streptomyces microflavus TaxID=1919 RepID=UPI003864E70E|nr:hypothetical protein OG269_28545 [Streptomyces microflavus]